MSIKCVETGIQFFVVGFCVNCSFHVCWSGISALLALDLSFGPWAPKFQTSMQYILHCIFEYMACIWCVCTTLMKSYITTRFWSWEVAIAYTSSVCMDTSACLWGNVFYVLTYWIHIHHYCYLNSFLDIKFLNKCYCLTIPVDWIQPYNCHFILGHPSSSSPLL